ncbi:hypothetical protein K438DRAFT_1782590 [Mycena galopus ATCC 62051]|nr:hypothetical protein K438DRAFT_1782590 [Mycena galopus ATCC 62051]
MSWIWYVVGRVEEEDDPRLADGAQSRCEFLFMVLKYILGELYGLNGARPSEAMHAYGMICGSVNCREPLRSVQKAAVHTLLSRRTWNGHAVRIWKNGGMGFWTGRVHIWRCSFGFPGAGNTYLEARDSVTGPQVIVEINLEDELDLGQEEAQLEGEEEDLWLPSAALLVFPALEMLLGKRSWISNSSWGTRTSLVSLSTNFIQGTPAYNVMDPQKSEFDRVALALNGGLHTLHVSKAHQNRDQPPPPGRHHQEGFPFPSQTWKERCTPRPRMDGGPEGDDTGCRYDPPHDPWSFPDHHSETDCLGRLPAQRCIDVASFCHFTLPGWEVATNCLLDARDGQFQVTAFAEEEDFQTVSAGYPVVTHAASPHVETPAPSRTREDHRHMEGGISQSALRGVEGRPHDLHRLRDHIEMAQLDVVQDLRQCGEGIRSSPRVLCEVQSFVNGRVLPAMFRVSSTVVFSPSTYHTLARGHLIGDGTSPEDHTLPLGGGAHPCEVVPTAPVPAVRDPAGPAWGAETADHRATPLPTPMEVDTPEVGSSLLEQQEFPPKESIPMVTPGNASLFGHMGLSLEDHISSVLPNNEGSATRGKRKRQPKAIWERQQQEQN